MSAELDALGGGDTRVAKVEGYCKVYPSIEDTTGSIVSVDYDRSIVVVRYFTHHYGDWEGRGFLIIYWVFSPIFYFLVQSCSLS